MSCCMLGHSRPAAVTAQLSRHNQPACALRHARHLPCRAGRRISVVRAAENGDKPAEDEEAAREEDRIASLEKATKQKRKPIPPQMRMQQPQGRKKGDWREGELFPEGWEQMGALEKGWQLWAGQRGFLFWSNKLALYAIVALGAGWVLFRFVGPALGLYTLTNDLLSPPVE